MTDKNGIEIKAGDIVEITGAYFKNDNGLWLVCRTPESPSWCGTDLSLHKISRSGKVAAAKGCGFWPIMVTVSSREKTREARAWNEANAKIEVKPFTVVKTTAGIREYIAADIVPEKQMLRIEWDWGKQEADRVRKQNAFLTDTVNRIPEI